MSSPLRATAHERAANVRSISDVPTELLPYGPARTHVIELARAGRDVYAYHAGPAHPTVHGISGWSIGVCPSLST